MEDKKIARNLRTSLTLVPMTAGANTAIASGKPDRVFIAFYANGSNPVRISPEGGVAGATAGMCVGNTRPFLEFDMEQYGNLVTAAWNGEATGGNNTLFVVESFLAANDAKQLV